VNYQEPIKWGSIVFLFAALVSWASLVILLRTGGRYVSCLSWNIFGLERLLSHWLGDGTSNIFSLAATLPILASSTVFTLDFFLIRSAKWRVVGIVLGVLLALASVVWMPNPFENM